jgi:Fur family ferric uptake transcriptional regulator
MALERTTRQRNAIRNAIESAGRPLTPEEILVAARTKVARLGLATVYRNLKLLLAEGAVAAITLSGDSPRYEAARAGHHHHFQCTTCRRVFDMKGCPGDLRRLAPRGFRVEHHEVTLYGRCSDCGRREARSAA